MSSRFNPPHTREKGDMGKGREIAAMKGRKRKSEVSESKFLPRKKHTVETGWKIMQKGIDKLINLLESKGKISFSSEEYMNIYTAMYEVCTTLNPAGKINSLCYSAEIYEKYKGALRGYIETTVLPSLLEKVDDTVSFLNEIGERWSNYRIMVRWLSRILHYLDRYYVQRNSVPSLNDVSLICFRESVYDKIHDRAKDGALHLINEEREGKDIDRRLLNNLVDFFMAIGLGNMEYYINELEVPILLNTADYYSRLAAEHILKDSCTEYMIMAEQKLKLEEERALNCLHADTRPKLLEIIRNKLLKDWEQQLLEKEHSGLRVLLREVKFDDLKRMFRLFSLVDGGLEQITTIFTQHIVDDGIYLIKQAEDAFGKKVNNKDSTGSPEVDLKKDSIGSPEVDLMKKIVDLQDKQLCFVTTCFGDHNLFHKAMRVGFEVFCNKKVAGNDMADLLSTYVDNILKKGRGCEKSSDEMIEETLDKIVRLLGYIDQKDLFAEFCRKKLGRRLLFDKSANNELERYLLSRLKQNNGSQFTSKMEGMIRDLQVAKEIQAEFANIQAEDCSGQNQGLEVVVSVLTTGFWPTYKAYDLHLPSEMTRAVDAFKTFYCMKKKSRKLTWLFSLGTCMLIGKFVTKPIELTVTTLQAATLMLFNDSEELSFNEIMEQLNLPENDVTRLLHSLSCAKYKILCKEPNTKSIGMSDIFTFNSKFTDRSRRIKVPLPPMDEKNKVIEVVNQDRRYSIDAAIVRIMKSRKVIGYQDLIIESLEQLKHRFKPDVKLIKKRVEQLIDLGYMERDTEDQSKFKYIA